MNKLLPLLAFSLLLLIPVSQNAFANHPTIPDCIAPGFLVTDPSLLFFGGQQPFCQYNVGALGSGPSGPCAFPYFSGTVITLAGLVPHYDACVTNSIQIQDITLPDQCQNKATLVGNHCEPDLSQVCGSGTIPQNMMCIAQSMGSMIGGTLLEINSVSLLVGAIGVNPIITGLVGITLAGIVGQTAWFVHRRKKAERM